MKISRNWLQSYFDKPIPEADKLATLFNYHSFEVEEHVDLGSDSVLDVKVLPDRAHYCLSHRGAAYELSVLTGLPLKADRIKETAHVTSKVEPSIKIEDPAFCRRYMARMVESVTVGASPVWIQKFLTTIGERSINSLVDATNITMFDIGQPMHIFDADKIQGNVVVRKAKEGERLVLLDGREITLTKNDNVIADDAGALVVAGAKGGKRAEVSSATTRIMIESANFEPTAVRRTSTRLDIRSESSKRYENEITPELTSLGIYNISALISELCPKAIFGPVVDIYPVKSEKKVLTFDPGYIAERLGVSVGDDKIRAILTSMSIDIEVKNGLWQLTIPHERLDLNIREDIVEEIGRIYGYEHIIGVLPPKTDRPVPILPSFYVSEKIKNILVSQGYSEVSLYALVGKGEVEIAYPLAKDKSYFRNSLSAGLRDCLEKNSLNADLLNLDQIKIFEIGRVSRGGVEKIVLGLGVCVIKKIKGVKSDLVISETLKRLSSEFGVNIDAKIVVENNRAVVEIDLDTVLGQYKMPKDASYKDLEFKPCSGNKYAKISMYPFMVRDVAVFVPENIDSNTVWQVIAGTLDSVKANDLIKRHSLFDTFRKDGKVSYAFRLVLQADDKTLTDMITNEIMNSVYKSLVDKGWTIR